MSSTVNGPASSGSQEVSRSKGAMDIRVHELADREVELLTGLLSRRPSFGIGRPSKRWLEHQSRLVAALPAEIKRPGNFLKRFVVKYGDSIDRSIFEYPPAVLCPTHYELHPRLMRRLFVMVLDEVTRHADRLRRSAALGATTGAEAGSVDPQLAALVDRVDGLGALWMEPELYMETFHAPPSDRRLVKVESFCEACTLAVLGANARTLADLRALILDRAERLAERRERRRTRDEAERAKRHEERRKRHEGRRERRQAEWEDEERLLEEAKNDPPREHWLRTGRAKDADRQRHDLMLDELEAKHRRHREREARRASRSHHNNHPEESSRHSRRSSRHHTSHRTSPAVTAPHHHQDRSPRLLRVVEIWIDHLGAERAAVARGLSDETLGMLRASRVDIDKAARQSRAVRPPAHASQNYRRASRQSVPVVDAAAAPQTAEGAAELRRAAGNFYRNSAAARSVYRPDSLAGGMSQVGGGDINNMPSPPMCGNGRGDRPDLAQRFAQGLDINGESTASGGLDPYGCGDEDDELLEEEELYDEFGYGDGNEEDPLVGYPEDERDYAREERSREKVAAWAVNAWAQSHRDLSRAELERGARSVLDGIHPAFRPVEKASTAADQQAVAAPRRASRASFSNKSAVPQALSVDKDKDKEQKRRKGSGVGSAIGSALGLGRKRGDANKGGYASNESAVWTDVSVHTDWRDRSRADLSEVPPVPAVPAQYANAPPPGVPSLVAGIDPNQSTEAFPEYADQLVDDEEPPTPTQTQNQKPQPAPWTPHKPTRKYCFVDSDVGTEVAREHRRADREYLKKNMGFLREPANPADNPFVGDPAARSGSVKHRSAAPSATDVEGGVMFSDPWAQYENASTSVGQSRSGASASSTTRKPSRSTAPTTAVGSASTSTPGGGRKAPLTPKVATAEEERAWRRNLTGVDEDDDISIRPDDSASNINWKRDAARDDVTDLGEFMRRAG